MTTSTSRVSILVLVAIVTALGSWMIGWWAIVPVAVFIGGWKSGVPGITLWTAVGALLSWSMLLAIDAVGGRFAVLGRALAGIFGVPLAAIIAVTLVLPVLLAWSGATLGQALSRALRTSALRPDAEPRA